MPSRARHFTTFGLVSIPSRARAVAATTVVVAIVVLLSACFPQAKGDASEVGGGAASQGPPVFPETGQVAPELLVDGLVYDFTNTQVDLDLWVPPEEAARCAAEKIVQAYGQRLSDLGYEPGRTGAGLNDIALQDEERTSISTLFQSCVDMVEAVAALFVGGDHMTSREALCMARGLEDQTLGSKFIDAWVFGGAVDPNEDDGELATAILAYTEVCLPDSVFTWNGVDLPGTAGNITTTTEGRPTGG